MGSGIGLIRTNYNKDEAQQCAVALTWCVTEAFLMSVIPLGWKSERSCGRVRACCCFGVLETQHAVVPTI